MVRGGQDAARSSAKQTKSAKTGQDKRISSRAAAKKVGSMAESTSEEEEEDWSESMSDEQSASQGSEQAEEVVKIQSDDDEDDEKERMKREKNMQAAQQALQSTIGSLTYSRLKSSEGEKNEKKSTSKPSAGVKLTREQTQAKKTPQTAASSAKRKRESGQGGAVREVDEQKKDEAQAQPGLDRMKRWKLQSDEKHEKEFLEAVEKEEMKLQQEDEALDVEIMKVTR